jgi:uncharacterized protein YndB with AHSA1/START domain
VTLRLLVLERDYDLPTSIVWDAFVDPVLVSGWLGGAHIDAVLDGRYDLDWLGSPGCAPSRGIIVHLAEQQRLTVETELHGRLDIAFTAVEGGSRGTSTHVRLAVKLEIDAPFEAQVRRVWVSSLDQLGALLHGHPVEWGAAMRRHRPGSSERFTRP